MSDDENVPDRDTCQSRIEEFTSITQTNEALAQSFLQDNDWDTERSISAFYDALSKEQEDNERKRKREDSPPTVDLTGTSSKAVDASSVEKLFGEGKCITTEPPPTLKFLSWNLDGLDDVNLKRRTRSVIALIQKHEPDIVFFQEVIPETADYFEKKLMEYKCIRGNVEGYFTMTLLRVFTIFYDKHHVVSFESSQMGRNLLVTEAHMGKLKLKLVNTHLESTADHSTERRRQLQQSFNTCTSYEPEYVVIFGGDLNLRDNEALIPPQFHDLWEWCGSPAKFKFTWDMTKNTNHSNFGKFKPRSRFDRIYFRFGQPNIAVPKHFFLTGSEKVAQTQSFPSDHWAVFVVFDLNHTVST